MRSGRPGESTLLSGDRGFYSTSRNCDSREPLDGRGDQLGGDHVALISAVDDFGPECSTSAGVAVVLHEPARPTLGTLTAAQSASPSRVPGE